MLSRRDASRLRACPSFTPMPSRWTAKNFTNWLTITKLSIGKWQPGLFRTSSSNDSSRTSRWDEQESSTPSVDGSPAPNLPEGSSNASSRANLVRLGIPSPGGHELLINMSNTRVSGVRDLAADTAAVRDLSQSLQDFVSAPPSQNVALSDSIDMSVLFCSGRSMQNLISTNVCTEDQFLWCSKSLFRSLQIADAEGGNCNTDIFNAGVA